MKLISFFSFLLFTLISCSSLASHDLRIFAAKQVVFERNFNPFDPTIGSFYAPDFVYEPLWIFNVWNPENDFPRLAESYEISPDFMSVTYHLRKGVKWSDGKPFTAKDVIFTVDYARKHPKFGINISLYDASSDSGLVTKAEEVSKYTVKFHLAFPSALAHQSVGKLYPLPRHIFEKVKDPVNFPNLNPVGTGPFTEVKIFRMTGFKICRNPNYYQATQLKVDCLRVPYFSGNEEMWASAKRGKIDWFGEGLQNPGKQYANYQPTNKYWLAPGGNVNMQLNTTKAPLNDIRFRQALSMALDRKKMVEVDTFGQTTPSLWPVGTGPLYASWYDTNVLTPYKYLMEFNPGEANQLLDQAGYHDFNKDGWREMPNGDEISLGIAVPLGWADWFNVVSTAVKNFRTIGINARVEGMDEQKWFERIPTGDFDIYMMWTLSGITPRDVYVEMFNANGMDPGKVADQAMHQFRSPEIEQLISDFSLTSNLSKQKRIIGRIQQKVAENLPVLTLFANPIWYEYSTKKFTGWVTPEDPFVRPQVHKGVPERLIHLLNLRPVK